jgi:hypothetical protein
MAWSMAGTGRDSRPVGAIDPAIDHQIVDI